MTPGHFPAAGLLALGGSRAARSPGSPTTHAGRGKGRSDEMLWRRHKKAFRIRKAFFGKTGAGDEIRTHDIHLGKVALYH
jgi:hypothetical protein